MLGSVAQHSLGVARFLLSSSSGSVLFRIQWSTLLVMPGGLASWRLYAAFRGATRVLRVWVWLALWYLAIWSVVVLRWYGR